MKNKTNKNFLQKYLVYPFGEILLLVIGIIIAVQINNWNTNRVEEIKAKKHLKSLINDMKTTVINNNKFIERYEEETKRIILFQEKLMLEPENITDSNLIRMFTRMQPITGTVLYQTAYDNMINSNSLQSIKNDTLKSSVSYLGTLYEYNRAQTKAYSVGWEDYMMPYIMKHANLVYSMVDSIPYENIVPQMKKINRNAFVNNTEFFNVLTLRNGYAQHFIGLYEYENKYYERSIKRIKRYLEEND